MSSPKYLWSIGCAIGMFSGIGAGYPSPARAGTLYQGWNYAIDSFNDGFDDGNLGPDSRIELYGMATRETDDSLYFAINANLSLEGLLQKRAFNKRISYGDLLLNFNSLDSSGPSETYGIRFDAFNDSRLMSGLYRGISATSFSRANAGFATLGDAHEAIAAEGGRVSYGDLAADSSAFAPQSSAMTNLYRGTYLGNVDLIPDVTNLGLDFNHFGATGLHTFGLRVDRSLLPDSAFIAKLFVESGNDGMALEGVLGDRTQSQVSSAPASSAQVSSSRTIPEPGSLIGIGVLSLIEISRRVWKQLQTEVVII